MTTKTQAAKAFAEKYGSYSPGVGDYVLATHSLPSLSATTPETVIRHLEEKRDLKIQIEEERNRGDRAIADLKAVMRFLGADDRYKDDTEEVSDYSWTTYSWEPPLRRTRVTKTALTKFREDIRTVDKATDAAAALDRLTGGAL